jgi:hypothetical protein
MILARHGLRAQMAPISSSQVCELGLNAARLSKPLKILSLSVGVAILVEVEKTYIEKHAGAGSETNHRECRCRQGRWYRQAPGPRRYAGWRVRPLFLSESIWMSCTYSAASQQPSGGPLVISPASTLMRSACFCSRSKVRAISATWGRSNRVALTLGFASNRPLNELPDPPPTSSPVRYKESRSLERAGGPGASPALPTPWSAPRGPRRQNRAWLGACRFGSIARCLDQRAIGRSRAHAHRQYTPVCP